MCFEFLSEILQKIHQCFLTVTEWYLHSVKFFSLPPFISSAPCPSEQAEDKQEVEGIIARTAASNWLMGYPIPYDAVLRISAQEMRGERDMLLIMAFVFPSSCYMCPCFPGCRWTSAYWWEVVNGFLFWINSVFFLLPSRIAFAFSTKLSLCWSISLLIFFLFSLCPVEKEVRKRLDGCCLGSSHHKSEK